MPLELQKCLRKLNQPTEQRSVNPFCPENAQIFTQKITNSYGKFEKYTCPLTLEYIHVVFVTLTPTPGRTYPVNTPLNKIIKFIKCDLN